MALHDWEQTRERLFKVLAEKGRDEAWLSKNILLPGETTEDLKALLREARDDGKINKHYAYWHLVTEESQARRYKEPKETAADPFLWAFWHPNNDAFRGYVLRALTREDGAVFKALSQLLLRERRPRVGERPIGSITEKELNHNNEIIARIQGYIDIAREQSKDK